MKFSDKMRKSLPTRKPGMRSNEDAEIKDLCNRIILECPRSGESIESWENRIGVNPTKESSSAGVVLTTRSFTELPLSRRTMRGLKEAEYKMLTPIQRSAIPYALAGLDVLGEARTGSGKTVSFIVPVIEKLYRSRWSREDGLGAIIISPTRELASQIFGVLRAIGSHHDLSGGCVVGGRKFEEEQKAFGGISILVCTPGRLLQHLEESPSCDASNLQLLVLDEADRLLDMGFSQTLKSILDYLPHRQTLLFSATLRTSVQQLAQLALNKPEVISVSRDSVIPAKLKQFAMVLPLDKKIDGLFSFLRSHSQKKLIVFLSSCKQVRFVTEAFRRLKVGPALFDLQGKQSLEKRMHIFESFAARDSAVCLICTDVAARGVDFPSVDWVVQADAPENADAYLHRAGRTARFESGGSCLTLLIPEEQEQFMTELEKRKVPKPTVVNPNKAKWVNLRGKLQPMLSKDPELKHTASKALQSYLKSLIFNGRVSNSQLNMQVQSAFATSLGLAQAPDFQLPAGPQPKSKGPSKLEKLKEKIRAKKAAKKDEDGWSDEMREDTEEKFGEKKVKLSKSERRHQRLKSLQSAVQDASEDDTFIPVAAVSPITTVPAVPETEAAVRAVEALKRKRTKIRKDGTMYVRGAGALGKTATAVTFNSDSESETTAQFKEDVEEKKAYVERVRQRLLARKDEDDARETLRVKEKHLKIKNKLRGAQPKNEQAQLADDVSDVSDEPADHSDDVARLEAEYLKMKNS